MYHVFLLCISLSCFAMFCFAHLCIACEGTLFTYLLLVMKVAILANAIDLFALDVALWVIRTLLCTKWLTYSIELFVSIVPELTYFIN